MYDFNDEKLLDAMHHWVMNGNQASAKYLESVNFPSHFTSYKGTLYRGTRLNEREFGSLKENGYLVLNNFTSWSKDKEIAKDFIKGKMNISKLTGTPVLFKKKMSDNIVLDIHSLLLFHHSDAKRILDPLVLETAMEDNEVLIESGITILEGEVEFI